MFAAGYPATEWRDIVDIPPLVLTRITGLLIFLGLYIALAGKG